MIKWVLSKFWHNFHWQITALIAGGVIALAIIASLSAGWLLNKNMTDLLKQQGHQITNNLAHQSILPLLSGVGSNAAPDVDSILALTNVQSAAIYTPSGKVLYSSEPKPPIIFSSNDKRLDIPFSPILFVEKEDYWIFKASVYDMDVFEQGSENIDSLFVQTPTLIGFVSVAVDRRSIREIQRSLVIDNLWISSGVAFILILFGFLFVKKLIKPLYGLAGQMKRAEEGEGDVRADLAGSMEIKHMGQAFNTMMTALENRQEYAEQQHESLLKEIDERRAVENALRSSEIRFRTVFENVGDGILIANEKGVIESANPAAVRFIRKPFKQFFGRSISETIFSNDLKGRVPVPPFSDVTEKVFIHSIKHGAEQVDLSLKFSEMVIDDKKKQIVVLHNITENQRQKKRIEALLSQHEAIVSSIPGIIVELDRQGCFTWWNVRTEEVTGCNGKQLKGRCLADFIEECEIGEINTILEQGFADGKVELHANMVTPQGIVPYQFNGLVIPSPSLYKSQPKLLAVGMDDSESIKTQAALQKTRDVALETARVKSEFLANMSHEIRTPMNGMMGMLQLIDGSDLNEEQQGYIDVALRSSDQLLNIINDILDFSKIEAGKMELMLDEYSPRTLIEDVVELFAKKAHEKGLKIYSRLALDIPHVSLGDAQRITQVLSNLIGNAIKFTDKGYILIDVHSVENDSYLPMMKVSIIDTGIGIEKDMQLRIFDSFSQIDGSSTRKYSGTGLGLAIVKKMVGLMGGETSIESEPGKGSDFSFTLPVKDVTSGENKRGLLDVGDVAYIGTDELQFSIIGDYLKPLSGHFYHVDMKKPTNSPLYLIEQDAIDELIKLSEIIDISDSKVVLLTNYRNYYDIDDFPLHLPVVKFSTPVRLNTLLRVLDTNFNWDAKPKKKSIIGKIENGRSDKRVLIVEDNETNRHVIISMLSKLGYQTDIASNGLEAIDKISEHDYAVVFMDCQMPVMDGYEATGKIRSMNRDGRPEVIIIAMTGNAMEGDKEKCLAAGMDAYIAKPVRLATLKEMLNDWIVEI